MKKILSCFFVFLFFLAIFLGWHSLFDGFFGVDPYYHAKHAGLMIESKNLTLVDPWIEFSFFNNLPNDPWWGFHILLIPFIQLFGQIYGLKIFTALSAALIFSCFYFVLRGLNARFPFIWTWLFFISSPQFLFRITLERPLVLSAALMISGLYLLMKNKYWPLFLLSIFYILFYNIAPMMLVIAIVYTASLFFYDYFQTKSMREAAARINLKIIIASGGGILAGLLIHPHTLNYIYVIYIHFWQAYFLHFTGVDLSIGAENYLSGFRSFLELNIIALAFFMLAIALFIKRFNEKKAFALEFIFFILSVFWFMLSLVLPRGIEYWLPVVWLFIAIVFINTAAVGDFTTARHFLAGRVNLKIAAFFIGAILFIFMGNNVFNLFYTFLKVNNSEDFYFQEANEWLISNTPPGSLVYYPVWSMFPRMFFYNDHNRYLAGIAPTFFYAYNPDVYYTWANIAYHGVYCSREWPCLDFTPRQEIKAVKLALKNILNTPYIIIPKARDTILYKVLDEFKEDYERVYENKELVIFRVID